MHSTVKKEIENLINSIDNIDNLKVCDLGSYNINGSVKEILPGIIGIDILEGSNIDLTIEPGIIPEEHKNKYDLLITTGAFQFCPHPEIFKKEIIELLKPNGKLFLTMCSEKCKINHSTSPNKYGYKDSFRMNLKELKEFFSDSFSEVYCYEIDENDYHDLIYYGVKHV